MLNLITNEYIKVWKKKSTLLWIALVLISAVGFQFIMKASLNYENNYYYEGTEGGYMSEAYIDRQISNIKEYTSSSDTYDSELGYFEAIKTYQLFSLDEWVYEEMRTVYNNYAEPLLNPTTKENYNSEQQTEMNEYFTALLSNLQKKDYTGFFKLLADKETATTYTFDGSESAISSPYRYKVEHGYTPDVSLWQSKLVDEVVYYQNTLESYALSGASSASSKQEEAKADYLIARYQLDHNMQYALSTETDSTYYNSTGISKFWSALESSQKLTMVISILIIVIAGGCVASEFSSGTIKFLLINPVKRSKIIISKYLMVLSFTIFSLGGLYVLNVILTMLFFGTGELSAPFLSVAQGSVVSSSAFLHIGKLYLYSAVEVIAYGTMAFAISSLFRSSSIAIGASVACLASGSVVTLLLQQFRQDWGRYLLFANTDLLSIKNGASTFPHHTMGFAIAILAVYMVVLLLMAYDGFCRREV